MKPQSAFLLHFRRLIVDTNQMFENSILLCKMQYDLLRAQLSARENFVRKLYRLYDLCEEAVENSFIATWSAPLTC